MLIVDAHEDLAWSMLSFGRDYTQSAQEIRVQESGSEGNSNREDALLGWPNYQHGNVALIFATLFATPMRWCTGSWDTICYADQTQAFRHYRAQLDLYQRLTDDYPAQFRLIHRRSDLTELVRSWDQLPEFDEQSGAVRSGNPVGLMILMEGAEAVRDPGELEQWWQQGVRLIGPAWAATPYCGGTKEPGPLTRAGYALLERMGELGFGLDLSHMDEKAASQALDVYPGPILASHSNALALLPGDLTNRHLSNHLIHGILERDGVIGVHFYNVFLKPGWKKGDQRSEVTLQQVVEQIDYICQIAGDAAHVGIGSDFDGGFGLQSVPSGINSIADLQKLAPLLRERGFSEQDCVAILGSNWLTFASEILPENP